MKLNALITQLSRIKEEYGNCEVVTPIKSVAGNTYASLSVGQIIHTGSLVDGDYKHSAAVVLYVPVSETIPEQA